MGSYRDDQHQKFQTTQSLQHSTVVMSVCLESPQNNRNIALT